VDGRASLVAVCVPPAHCRGASGSAQGPAGSDIPRRLISRRDLPMLFRSSRRASLGPRLWLTTEGAGDLARRRHGSIRVAGLVFFLRDRSASSLVGRMPIAVVFERLLTRTAGRVLRRRRARVDGGVLPAVARFSFARLPVADSRRRLLHGIDLLLPAAAFAMGTLIFLSGRFAHSGFLSEAEVRNHSAGQDPELVLN
jgi:hypothetical protein